MDRPPVDAEVVPIETESDIVLVRQRVRIQVVALGFGLVDQTKTITAASELARNTLIYGGGGRARLEILQLGVRRGLRVTFEDEGPGIANIELALKDGYTTGHGLGLGLSGARRLVNEFSVESQVGVGTRVVITKWK